jgi:hypothetical protein
LKYPLIALALGPNLAAAQRSQKEFQPVQFALHDAPGRAQIEAHPAPGLVDRGTVDQKSPHGRGQQAEEGDDQHKVQKDALVELHSHGLHLGLRKQTSCKKRASANSSPAMAGSAS